MHMTWHLYPRTRLQVYGLGLSEEFLQDFMKQTGTQPVIATKFAPLPWRFKEQNVVEACK